MAASYSKVVSEEVKVITSKEDYGKRPWSVIIKTRDESVRQMDVLDALKDRYDLYSIQKTQFGD